MCLVLVTRYLPLSRAPRSVISTIWPERKVGQADHLDVGGDDLLGLVQQDRDRPLAGLAVREDRLVDDDLLARVARVEDPVEVLVHGDALVVEGHRAGDRLLAACGASRGPSPMPTWFAVVSFGLNSIKRRAPRELEHHVAQAGDHPGL